MDKDDKPFKEETLGVKIVVVISITLLIVFALAFVFGLYYFGVLGFFNLLGVKYDSLSSILLFVVLYFVFGFVGDLVIKVFQVLLSFLSYSKQFKRTFEIFIYFLVNLIIISVLDIFMESIEINIVTRLLLALLIAVCEYTFDQKDKKSSN